MISVVVAEFRYGPRTYWKGFLRLSLVSCPIALYPATSEREKIHFHQLNRKTGNRIQYKKVDAETGREVDRDDIIKGYEKSKGDYVPVEPEELEAVAIESKRVIEIDEFVPRKASPLHITLVYFASETMENTVRRLFFLLAGHAFLVLAIVGVFLPILPTTPFVIAASACYMRSSKRFHAMLHKSKWFGPMLENWERDRSISLRSKIVAVVMIGASLIISFAFFSVPLFAMISASIACGAVSLYILTRPSPQKSQLEAKRDTVHGG